MKRLLFLFAVCYSIGAFAQKKDYAVYNYSELVKMIQQEQDSIFELANAYIVFDPQKDKRFSGTWSRSGYDMNSIDTIYVEKEIVFNKVIFEVNFRMRDSLGRQIMPFFNHMIFEKPVRFENSHNAHFKNSVFKDVLRIRNDDGISEIVDKVKDDLKTPLMWMRIRSCTLKKGIFYSNFPKLEDNLGYDFELSDSKISPTSTNENGTISIIQMNNQRSFEINNNTFYGEGWFFLFPRVEQDLSIKNNDFGGAKIFMRSGQKNVSEFSFLGNKLNKPILLEFPAVDDNAIIGWSQLEGMIIDQASFDNYFRNMSEHGLDTIPKLAEGHFRGKEKINYYLENLRIQKEDAFKQEIKIRGRLYRLYKNQYQTEDANSVYMELKDLETERLKYQFKANPSFDKYFKWKVNQFLKVFSNYGTEPSKAVTFSFYVVLFFALIYLLFPNSWDKHGKNRIMDRYRFFTKYMNREAGIHEVYLEEQKEELLESEEFKNYMLAAEKTIPSFFLRTAMPLYKWSISGMKFSASLLKRVDVMKGTWQNVPEKRRTWKTILLVGAFSVALLYDVTIKILNALMLSINTFTTLGFGEIPIKGLPRYLAIIQGFIGWFMLTIFSVSLISQLLN